MKYFLSLLLMAMFTISHSQEFKIESSKSYEKQHPNSVTEVVFATPYGFSTYSYLKNVFLDNEKEITITKYDQQLNDFETVRFNLPKLDRRAADLDRVIELDTKLIFISNSMTLKDQIRNVYAQVYDSETSTVSEAKIIASFSIDSYSKSGQVEVSTSENKNQIAILAYMPFEKKTKQKIKVWTFDSNLQNIWESDHTLSTDSERAHNQDLHISNNGIVYILNRYDYNSKKAISYLITINNNDKVETVLSEPNFFIRNTAFLNLGFEHRLIGFYLEDKIPRVDNNSDRGNSTTGVFMYDISNQKLLAKHKFTANGKPVKNLTSVAPVFTHMFGDDIYIVGEKQTYSSKFREGNSTELDYLYTHGPTIFINLDNKGTLKDMLLLNNTKTYKNEESDRASLAVLPLNGLVTFYNNPALRISRFYGFEEKISWNEPPTKYEESYGAVTSYLVPSSLKKVSDFNLAYFVNSHGNKFWLNKITW